MRFFCAPSRYQFYKLINMFDKCKILFKMPNGSYSLLLYYRLVVSEFEILFVHENILLFIVLRLNKTRLICVY